MRFTPILLTAAATFLAAGCQTDDATVPPLGYPASGDAAATAGAASGIASGGASGDIPGGGGNSALFNHHATSDTPVNAQAVEDLAVAWTYETPANVTHTPLVDGDRVYFADWGGTVYAVDAATGEMVWENTVEEPKAQWPWHGFAGTGAQSDDVLFEASAEGNAFALDKQTGEVLWETRFANDPQGGNVGRLTYHDGVLFVPVQSPEEALAAKKEGFEVNFRGHVVALDADTGEVLWDTPLVTPPHNGVAVWTGFALDPQTGTLYTTTGNNYTGEATELSDSLIALDAATGEIRWHRQVFQHDVWTMADPEGPDYDFGAAPQIFTATVDGQPRRLVAAGNKSGTFFVFDAQTGEDVWTSTIGYGSKGGGMHAEASIGDGAIYLWGNNSYFYKEPKKHPMDVGSVDAATGKWRWVIPKAQPAALTTAGFLANDVYFVPSLDGQVRAYHADDGKLLWTSQTHGSIGSSVWVDGPRLLFGTGVPDRFGGIASGQGVVAYAVNAPDGGDPGEGAGVASASADDGRLVEVVAQNFDFDPSTITAQPGEQLRVKLVNVSSAPHSIEFHLAGENEAELASPVPPGQSATLTFTAPQEPGEYVYYCPVANHHARGMEGTLIVEAPGSAQ